MTAVAQHTAIPFLAGRKRRAKITLSGLTALLLIVTVMAVCSGAVPIAPAQVTAILLQYLGVHVPWEFEAQHQTVVIGLRLPRIVLGIFTGAALAVAGATLQGLFRNPLADPALSRSLERRRAGCRRLYRTGSGVVDGNSHAVEVLPVACFCLFRRVDSGPAGIPHRAPSTDAPWC